MITIKNKLPILLSVFTIIFIAFSAESKAATFYASPSGSGSACGESSPCDIVKAVNSASSGDTVILQTGTYDMDDYFLSYGILYLDLETKAITLEGEDRESVIITAGDDTGESRNYLLKLSGDKNQVIKNLTISASTNYASLLLDTGASPTIESCIITNSVKSGLLVNDGSPLIQNNIFKDNKESGIYITGGKPVIKNNVFLGNDSGIFAYQGTIKLIIIENVFAANKTAIYYTYSDDDGLVTMTKNYFVGNRDAINENNNIQDQPYRFSYLDYNNIFIGQTRVVYIFDVGYNYIRNNIFLHNKTLADMDDADSDKQDRGYFLIGYNGSTEFDSDPGVTSTTTALEELDLGTSSAVSTSTLTDSSKSWTPDQWAGSYLAVDTSSGRKRLWYITANTDTTLTLANGSAFSNNVSASTSIGSSYIITTALPQEDYEDAGSPESRFNDTDGTPNDIGPNGGSEYIIPQAHSPAPRLGSYANEMEYQLNGEVVLAENPLTYVWEQVSGATATLSSLTEANPIVTTPTTLGEIVFHFTVTDTVTGLTSTSDNMTLIINEGALIGDTKYATLAKAYEASSSGNTIILGEGTFVESISIRKNLTIQGSGMEKTVLDSFDIGQYVGFSSLSVHTGALNVESGATSVTIQDLSAQNFRGAGFTVKTSGATVVFQNVAARDNESHGFYANARGTISFYGCISARNSGDGFHRDNASSSTTIFDDIEATGNDDDGIEFASTTASFSVTNSLFSGNDFAVNGGTVSQFYNNIIAGDKKAIESTAASLGANVVHNLIYDFGYEDSIYIKGGSFIFANNIVVNQNYGLPWMTCDAGVSITEDYNLLYNLHTDSRDLDSDCPSFGVNDLTGTPLLEELDTGVATDIQDGGILVNSIASWAEDEWKGQFLLVNTSAFYIRSNTENTLIVEENTSDLNGTYLLTDSASIGDSYVISSLRPELDEEAGISSPAIDAATTDYMVATDRDGNPRPLGDAPDMGPFENDTISVQFDELASEGEEVVRTQKVKIVSNNPAIFDVDITISVTGTATLGDDYTVDSGATTITTTIPTGSDSVTIDLSILDDSLVETDETIILTITDVTHSVLGPRKVHMHTIIDNDEEEVVGTDDGDDSTGGETSSGVTDTGTTTSGTTGTTDSGTTTSDGGATTTGGGDNPSTTGESGSSDDSGISDGSGVSDSSGSTGATTSGTTTVGEATSGDSTAGDGTVIGEPEEDEDNDAQVGDTFDGELLVGGADCSFNISSSARNSQTVFWSFLFILGMAGSLKARKNFL